jgi:hypothetical protein
MDSGDAWASIVRNDEVVGSIPTSFHHSFQAIGELFSAVSGA